MEASSATMCCSGHHVGDHHDRRNHRHRTSVCACGVTLLLCVCTVCAQALDSGHRCASGSCRSLASDEHVSERQSFIGWLAEEDPINHIIETYRTSGATESAVGWLVLATRCVVLSAEVRLLGGHGSRSTSAIFTRCTTDYVLMLVVHKKCFAA